MSRRLRKVLRNELQEEAKAELARRERLAGSFRAFVSDVMPRFKWYRHAEVLADRLQDVADGKIKRLMVQEPPRHGKSQLVSRLFPAYCLYRHPLAQVGLCSYSADLALQLSRASIDFYTRTGRELHPDASAKSNWMTVDGGEMWAAGVGGPITGKGFTFGIVDDPIKNDEDALSDAFRESQKEWWRSIFTTREEPDAAIVVVMTRWHEDDLVGWLLSEEENEPQRWHIVNFEAIKTSDPVRLPKTCTLEPDWREDGEALCPERYPLEKLLSKKRSSEAWWNSLYQQRPTTMGGDVWKKEWFREYVDTPRDLTEDGYDWDLAYTEDERNSACAYLRSGRDGAGNVYVSGFDFRWLEFPSQMKWMVGLVGPHFVENKASGKSIIPALRQAGVPAKEVKVPNLDKVARSRLVSVHAQNGKVFIHKAIKDRLLNDGRQGLMLFPKGSHNDVNDAFTQALNRHFSGRRGAKLIVGR